MDELDVKVNAVKPTRPITAASLRDYAARLAPYALAYSRFARHVSAERSHLGTVTDPDIRLAWRLIVERTRIGAAGLTQTTSTLSAGDYAAFAAHLKVAAARIRTVDTKMQAVLTRVNARYGSIG
jgi:hypothetical protein